MISLSFSRGDDAAIGVSLIFSLQRVVFWVTTWRGVGFSDWATYPAIPESMPRVAVLIVYAL